METGKEKSYEAIIQVTYYTERHNRRGKKTNIHSIFVVSVHLLCPVVYTHTYTLTGTANKSWGRSYGPYWNDLNSAIEFNGLLMWVRVLQDQAHGKSPWLLIKAVKKVGPFFVFIFNPQFIILGNGWLHPDIPDQYVTLLGYILGAFSQHLTNADLAFWLDFQ